MCQIVTIPLFLLQIFKVISTNADQTMFKQIPKNWTTCEQFLSKTKQFDESAILNINWVNIYSWNVLYSSYKTTYKFNIPYKLLMERYQMNLKHVVGNINWKNASFFLETTGQHSSLMFATTKPGLYRVIPSFLFRYKVFNKKIYYAMKLINFRYLGIMECEQQLCEAMAPDYDMPDDDEICEAVKAMEFYNGFTNPPCLFDANGTKVDPPKAIGPPAIKIPQVEEELDDEDVEIDAQSEDDVF